MTSTLETTKSRTEVRDDAERFSTNTRTRSNNEQSTGSVAALATSGLRIVDAEDYEDNDIDRGRMFLDALGDAIRPVQGTTDWAWWNGVRGRLEVLEQNQLTKLWMTTVMPSLSSKAAGLHRAADVEEECGLESHMDTRKLAAEYERRARMAGNRSQRLSSLSEAHTLSDNPVRPEDFDRNPFTLGVANGVLDFRSEIEELDMLRAARPEDTILENTRVAYRPGAKHPLFENYLDTFLPDPEYRRFVRKVFGYCVLGRNPERLMVFLKGKTSTGKSTLISAIEAALGDYGSTVSAGALFREKQDAGPAPEILRALPKRVVFSSEVGTHNRLHADVIKRLTGGDAVTARALYSNDVVTRVPMFTPVIATNSMPTIADGDDALWRRILVLPFETSVPPGSEVHTRIEDVPEALEAVLSWLVSGLVDYQADGLDPDNWPASVHSAKAAAIGATSDFAGWFGECVEVTGDPERRIPVAALWETFQRWETENGTPDRERLAQREFKRRVEAQGVKSARKNETMAEIRHRVGSKATKSDRTKPDMFLGVRQRLAGDYRRNCCVV